MLTGWSYKTWHVFVCFQNESNINSTSFNDSNRSWNTDHTINDNGLFLKYIISQLAKTNQLTPFFLLSTRPNAWFNSHFRWDNKHADMLHTSCSSSGSTNEVFCTINGRYKRITYKVVTYQCIHTAKYNDDDLW